MDPLARSRVDARPERLGWLPPLVLVVNLAVLGLLMGYSSLNLRPDLSTVRTVQAHTYYQWPLVAAAVAPAAAALVFLWPALRWLRLTRMDEAGDAPLDVPISISLRAANAPLVLAAFSVLGWILVTALASTRALASAHDISLGLAVHLVLRPFLAGLIAGAATFFGAEYLLPDACLAHAPHDHADCREPSALAGARVTSSPSGSGSPSARFP